MEDIVHLLPDSIANQIAAGEVVQRPASVVKELVENSIDAGATNIQLIIKDAGRTLIQVVDNGKGMSTTDARMAFERHATSKIKSADDLFALSTMGFRGEALPSIAAVAHVEIRTRAHGSEVGVSLSIAGSKVESQDIVACDVGTNLSVKNLFFNVPARRKFLKANDTERRHIMSEFERIVLVYPEIEFSFIENNLEIMKYPISSLKQRIVNVLGKALAQQLLAVEVDTSIVKVSGFVGKPESARRTRAQQFFFINGRYMRNPYFNSAMTAAYEQLIPSGERANYFLYLQVDPSTIDVNIHPTKTEVKFENEQPIWQILFAAIKEALGKFNEIPSIDFDTEGFIDIPMHDPSSPLKIPQVAIDTTYNPFKASPARTQYKRPSTNWEAFYDGFKDEQRSLGQDTEVEDIFSSKNTVEASSSAIEQAKHYQYKNKYIVTSVKSGLMFIDQRRAHIRILYDKLVKGIKNKRGVSQRTLFPEVVEFSPSEASMLPYVAADLAAVGFDLNNLGGNSYSINGIPSELAHIDAVQLVQNMLSKAVETGSDVKEEVQEAIALSMAESAAIEYGTKLSDEEIWEIVSELFLLPEHSYTPSGKTIISLLENDVIEKMFR